MHLITFLTHVSENIFFIHVQTYASFVIFATLATPASDFNSVPSCDSASFLRLFTNLAMLTSIFFILESTNSFSPFRSNFFLDFFPIAFFEYSQDWLYPFCKLILMLTENIQRLRFSRKCGISIQCFVG